MQRERKIMTDAGIKALIARAKKKGKPRWQADGAIPRSHGGLQFCAHPNGAVHGYWRYSAPDGEQKPRIPLGLYTERRADGALTLNEFRAAVAAKAALYAAPESRDVRTYLEREAEREREARAAAERERTSLEEHTLEKLLATYIAHQRKHKKESASDAENIFANHITKAHPTIAAKPAREVTSRDIVAVLRTLTEAGKGRTAAKLRAYLRAAYAIAVRSALDSAAPAAFLGFNIEANPVEATGTLSQYTRALERALSEAELRAYWAELKDSSDSPARDAQLLGLYLGGQRVAQLLRATVPDVDLEAGLIQLHDPKGKRTQARVHVLPIPKAALPIVKRCIARAEKQKNKWLFSSHGSAHLRPETVTQTALDICDALRAKQRAERIVREPFQLRDLRRTAETLLARMGVSKDVRAQIQSHGLGGIQSKHYDKHTYLPEKTAALDAWAQYLDTAPGANVRQPRGRR